MNSDAEIESRLNETCFHARLKTHLPGRDPWWKTARIGGSLIGVR